MMFLSFIDWYERRLDPEMVESIPPDPPAETRIPAHNSGVAVNSITKMLESWFQFCNCHAQTLSKSDTLQSGSHSLSH